MITKAVFLIFSTMSLWSLLFGGFAALLQHSMIAIALIECAVVMMLGAWLFYRFISRAGIPEFDSEYD